MRLKETQGVAFVHVVISTALIVLAAGCSQSGSQSPEPERLSLQFEEAFTIGGDTSATLNNQLASPAGVRTDSDGNIYVSDRGATEIKVFDAEGNFLRSIGQEGNGPGEFGQITAIEVGNQDTLIVMDEPHRRITKFLASGEVVGSQSLQGLSWAWPRSGNFHQLPGYRYVSLHKKREIPGTTDPEKRNLQTKLIHTYRTNFKDQIDSFAPLDSLGQPDHEFINLYLSTVNPGHIEPSQSGDIWYAPGIYDGRIYRFEEHSEGWLPAPTAQGYMTPQEAIILDSNDDGAVSIVTYTPQGSQSFTGYIQSESLGLFQLADGRLVHVSTQLDEDKRKTVIELFSADGTLKGVGQLEKFTYSNTERRVPIQSIWMDNNDRLYFVDNSGVPMVRVGRISGL